ncbi:MAG TPA: cytochrome P460 family protein [Pyrinomonadaceae bacterium]
MRSRCAVACLKLSTVVLLLSASCACAASAGPQKSAPGPPAQKPLAGAELIAGYRAWTRVNPEPAVFHSKIAIQCSMPSPEQRKLEEQNPHRDKFVTVYVNDAGRRAMLEEKSPRFPVGSLVVKEKLPARDAAEPELLTAMLKREAGYDPEGGDWEYLVLDGRGEELRARGRLETCRACHQTYPHTDFVARNYLPYDLYRKLK